jgi:2-keto-4-pentenoate hydratase/2-oxohepta-3-ene-1,7-dioic acid hydratase in catechol pathway
MGKVNGETKQSGSTKDLVFNVPTIDGLGSSRQRLRAHR